MTNPDRIMLAHGGGGELTKELIEEHILKRLGIDDLKPLMDSAVLPRPGGRICMTTDSFVVQPLIFPGGDIGRLAVCGTVNDLSVMGARPIGLSLALIIEEGLEMAVFDQILDSIAEAADEADVTIVTGDTKVIERRSGDGLVINTAGIGELPAQDVIDLNKIGPGHKIICSGNIADHGLAVMSAREGIAFDTDIKTDAAPLNGLIAEILATGADIAFMRDPTRSGIAGVFADLSEDTNLSLEVVEAAIPITGMARHVADALGLDPLTVANEGKIIIITAPGDVDKVLAACRAHKYGRDAACIGQFIDAQPPLTELICRGGGRRIVQRPYGEELPRIC